MRRSTRSTTPGSPWTRLRWAQTGPGGGAGAPRPAPPDSSTTRSRRSTPLSLRDAAVIVAPPRPRHAASAAPVHLLFVATRKDAASYQRCLVIAERRAALALVEDFVSLQNKAYFTNAVTEVVLAGDAQVHHVRVQRESAAAFHIANCAVSLAHGSRYHSVSVALGARISRHNLGVRLASEGAECAINGLALIGGKQLADTHTLIDHAMPQGTSRAAQVHRRRRRARSVQRQHHGPGRRAAHRLVAIEPQPAPERQGARRHQAPARDLHRARRQMRTWRDTVGQLCRRNLLLKSRGLSDTAARNLLTYAFGAEVIERIPVASLRTRLEQAVLAQTTAAPAEADPA